MLNLGSKIFSELLGFDGCFLCREQSENFSKGAVIRNCSKKKKQNHCVRLWFLFKKIKAHQWFTDKWIKCKIYTNALDVRISFKCYVKRFFFKNNLWWTKYNGYKVITD